jgi:hypothetical protein
MISSTITACVLLLEPVILDEYTKAKYPAYAGPEESLVFGPEFGEIVYVGKASITLRVGFPENRTPTTALPEKTYPLTTTFATGAIHPDTSDRNSYLLAALEPGDRVIICKHSGPKGGEYIHNVNLVNRKDYSPIPPSKYAHPEQPYHVWQNAINDWNSKGIAIPDNILKQYGKEHPPQPQWMKDGKPAPFK